MQLRENARLWDTTIAETFLAKYKEEDIHNGLVKFRFGGELAWLHKPALDESCKNMTKQVEFFIANAPSSIPVLAELQTNLPKIKEWATEAQVATIDEAVSRKDGYTKLIEKVGVTMSTMLLCNVLLTENDEEKLRSKILASFVYMSKSLGTSKDKLPEKLQEK